jgi:hypothetical protein
MQHVVRRQLVEPLETHLGFRQAFKEVLQISRRIDVQALATGQHRVDHRAALAGPGVDDEEEVLFLPMQVGRMSFSQRLLSISMNYAQVDRVDAQEWLELTFCHNYRTNTCSTFRP